MSFSSLFTTLVAINFVLGCSPGPEKEAIQTVSSTLISISTEYDRATPRLGEEPASPDLEELYRDRRVLGVIRASTQFLIEWPQERRVVIYENENGIPTVAIHDGTSPQLIASFALPNDAETRVWGFVVTSTLGWDSPRQTLPTLSYYADDAVWATSYSIRLSDQALSFASIRKSDQRVFRSGPSGDHLEPPTRNNQSHSEQYGHYNRPTEPIEAQSRSSTRCSDWIPAEGSAFVAEMATEAGVPLNYQHPNYGFALVEMGGDHTASQGYLLLYFYEGMGGSNARNQDIAVFEDEGDQCWLKDIVSVGGSYRGRVVLFEIRNQNRVIFSAANQLPTDAHVGATGYGTVAYHVENGSLRID